MLTDGHKDGRTDPLKKREKNGDIEVKKKKKTKKKGRMRKTASKRRIGS